MPISAVNSSLFPLIKKQEVATGTVATMPAVTQNNNLVDLNYGSSLINLNKIAFKGVVPVVEKGVSSLTKKVSVAFNTMLDEDVLLVGKNLETAKNALRDSKIIKEYLFKRVFFVKDEHSASVLAFKVNSKGFDELHNLSEAPVSVNRIDAGAGQVESYKKGDKARVNHLDYIYTMHPENGFYIDENAIEYIDELPKGDIEQFDLSDILKKEISQLNYKNLNQLKSEKEKVSPARKIMFNDVGGQDAAVAEVKRKILFQLKFPNFFANNLEGGHGALFVGPPGNGKSRTAQALANEAEVPFYNINGQLLEGELVGQSAHNIEEYFNNARSNQPCIMFFDEADAIFGERTNIHKYVDQSTNMYLDQITKLEEEGAQVYLIAATNHPEIIDKAALRRFDTKIEFTNLDTPERCKAVFDVHTKGEKLENFDSETFMKKLRKSEMSGSDISNLVMEAKMNSIERQGIFEQMEKGTFKDSPDFKLTLIGEDFDKALEKLLAQRKMVGSYSKEKVIGGFGDALQK